MKFGRYLTVAEMLKRDLQFDKRVNQKELAKARVSDLYQMDFRALPVCDHSRESVRVRFFAEKSWVELHRPYYNVYPFACSAMRELDLKKATVKSIQHATHKCVLALFPVGNDIESMIFSANKCQDHECNCGRWTLTMCGQRGESKSFTSATYTWSDADIERGMTVGETLDGQSGAVRGYGPSEAAMLQYSMFMLLAQNDKRLFEPVINDRYRHLDVNEAVRRSVKKRHGQEVFNVGKSLESIPHYRRPHPALYWTGEGRGTATIIFRQGAVVNRKSATDIPTGYMGK